MESGSNGTAIGERGELGTGGGGGERWGEGWRDRALDSACQNLGVLDLSIQELAQ